MKKSNNILLIISLFVIISIFNSCKPKPESEPEPEPEPQGYINGYGWVDLGLPSGLKWATCNVGASSTEQCGNYYAWGETETKSEYTSGNCSTYGKDMGDISGNPQYDVATFSWGSTWRMPTKEEMQELVDHCEFVWIQDNDVYLYKITGPNTNSIFLPAVGYRFGTSSFGSCIIGCYWSSTSIGYDGDAYHLYLDRSYESDYVVDADIKLYNNRSYGHTIRPVSD